MLDALRDADVRLFQWINTHHADVLDWVMWIVGQHWCWGLVLAAVLVLTTLRVEPRRWWVVGLGIALCFLLADQGSVHLFKEQFQRLRPCYALPDVRMFRTRCGGAYGFVSSHAANAFAVVVFLWTRYLNAKVPPMRSRSHLRPIMVLSLAWAILTSYSRVYLGKHYPADLVGGALYGIAVGLAVGWAVRFFEKKASRSETK